ncbi:hypothetical protein EF903_06965 [Streptomyces sp. WAC05292]|uniref:hypothetical protein n=1 Tax=Streptomyces sp. WAC05292 TaxID=2487418 RepID=UPI000F74290A|nr:hypothetical protein [Streptomyces sp. WAC05292]RSS94272.1 hypothetical protein EF903_06965 [Streptomyces sp. WAC05292]
MADYTHLVAAAAHAAGPCPEGQEATWQARVRDLAVELAFTAREVDQAMKTLDETHPFSAYLEKIEIEPTSRRGLLTLRPPGGGTETIRTEQQDTNRGAAMISRAEELVGRWVLVYRYNEPTAASRKQRGEFGNVRMVARLMDLGEGALAFSIAQSIITADAGGDASLAVRLWRDAGLPERGMIPVADLEPVRQRARAAANR